MASETRRTDAVMDPGVARLLPAPAKQRGKSAVYSRLEEAPGSFAFAQAVSILRKYLSSQGVADPLRALRFRVNPNLSFPPGDMERISVKNEGEDTKVELMLNLMGLHGAASPLPLYFTEYIAQHQDEPDALRDFFDIFNHKCVSILYDIWHKYRYYIQYEEGASDLLSSRFFGFIGMGYDELRTTGTLNWSRLLAYMGLIAFKGDAAGSLESTLRHYFSHPSVYVIPCIQRTVVIHGDQLCRMGMANTTLDHDCILGEEVPDQTGKFRIFITDLSWERFNSFLPDNAIFSELTILVKTVLRSRLQFDVELRLIPDEIRPFILGSSGETRLGWSTWLCDGGDGIVVLEPTYQVEV